MQVNLLENINKNRQSFMIIALAVAFFVSFSITQGKQDEKQKDGRVINIGFYKQDKEAKEYFSALREKLKKAFNMHKISIKEYYYGNPDALCHDIKNNKIDIAGEISPIAYVNNYSYCDYSPLLGIEYNGNAYYYSVFFVPLGDERNDITLKADPGFDNIGKIRTSLMKKSEGTLALYSALSTSGYYYPRAYLLNSGINIDIRQDISRHETIFKSVLRKNKKSDADENKNKYFGGFLADFRYNYFYQEYSHCAPDTKNKDCWKNDELAMPHVIDKTDPIPNGVFVISNESLRSNIYDLNKIRRIWKTVRNVKMGNSNTAVITGWRQNIKRDLDLVEVHKNTVNYNRLLVKNYQVYLAVSICLVILVISVISYLYIKKIPE